MPGEVELGTDDAGLVASLGDGVQDLGHSGTGGFHSHGGTPVNHPFTDRIFHEINHPAIGGTPMTMETSR